MPSLFLYILSAMSALIKVVSLREIHRVIALALTSAGGSVFCYDDPGERFKEICKVRKWKTQPNLFLKNENKKKQITEIITEKCENLIIVRTYQNLLLFFTELLN